jgi:hypothetical protein
MNSFFFFRQQFRKFSAAAEKQQVNSPGRNNSSTNYWFVTGVSTAAASITGLAYWQLKALQRREEERKIHLNLKFKAQTEALSKELILGVLKEEQSLRLVTQLLLAACKHPEFKAELSRFLKTVFIDDPRGSGALKKFVVDDVVLDPWVKDNLLALVKKLGSDISDDKRIYPDEFLMVMLKHSALDALNSDTFSEELWVSVSKSLWNAFFSWGSLNASPL